MSWKEPKNGPPDDESLIEGFLQGDADCLSRVRIWIRAASRPYGRQLHNELDDVEQEVLLDLTRAFRDQLFHRKSGCQTYVHTFVHHKCIDRIRAHRRRQFTTINDEELPSTAPDQLDRVAREEEAWLALQVLDRVPQSCLELWRMIEEGLSYGEMSKRLGVSEGTLRVRVLRCRKQARAIRAQLIENREGRPA